ncbi:cytochrome bc1 complex Rieske iron-sulfur subunit [Nocardiopsis terrae]|uniref:Cytochrome bc1 complex Rieske iron-sulfur subunit n=1 Tax=Nocardiopsis terrae TaxID=372655 RepID=A0ABR9HEA1_9ACTN|nr:Rieske 2Fe-2S domain-containing protein [Nocardiopsis terrae]MBE1457359.1 ubiquinol-cytochrome c reductase iron-sulfur subunit [Nocardiopsis terrae]GHC91910.1 cytochrome bc1 complex Rieske iron-sulfur subunit [Nocardiopsis terrae]
MTENNNDNNTADDANERVVGTPTDTADVVSEATPEPRDDHNGPYLASETHKHPEEQQRRGEKIASLWFVIAFLSGIGFLVSYFLFPPNAAGEPAIGDPQISQYSNMLLGGTLTLAMFGIGAGMTVWARNIMPHYEVASPYDELPSKDEEKGSFSEFFMKSADESGFTKRPLMRRTLIAAMLPLGIAPIVLLRDTGPVPGDRMKETRWTDGMRMYVEGTHRYLRAEDVENDPYGMISALPALDDEGYPHGMSLTDQAKSVILLIKIPEEDWESGMNEKVSEDSEDTHLNWTHQGIVAYSKICTHVGCPAALYERTTHRILCPCHQSTFDAANAAEVVFGPAHRPLPQLPIGVDDEGYLVARGDFNEPTGPTFWEYAED